MALSGCGAAGTDGVVVGCTGGIGRHEHEGEREQHHAADRASRARGAGRRARGGERGSRHAPCRVGPFQRRFWRPVLSEMWEVGEYQRWYLQ